MILLISSSAGEPLGRKRGREEGGGRRKGALFAENPEMELQTAADFVSGVT